MDLETLETADKVFEALGGPAGVQDVTGGKPSQVSNWKAIGSFPPNTYVAMIDALQARGKAAPPSLWRMKATEAVAS